MTVAGGAVIFPALNITSLEKCMVPFFSVKPQYSLAGAEGVNRFDAIHILERGIV